MWIVVSHRNEMEQNILTFDLQFAMSPPVVKVVKLFFLRHERKRPEINVPSIFISQVYHLRVRPGAPCDAPLRQAPSLLARIGLD